MITSISPPLLPILITTLPAYGPVAATSYHIRSLNHTPVGSRSWKIIIKESLLLANYTKSTKDTQSVHRQSPGSSKAENKDLIV